MDECQGEQHRRAAGGPSPHWKDKKSLSNSNFKESFLEKVTICGTERGSECQLGNEMDNRQNLRDVSW